MDLQMLAEGGGVGVGFVTTAHLAQVRFVGCVHVHVLLAVRRVRESAVAALYLTFKWFLA